MAKVTKWFILLLFLVMLASGSAGVYLISQSGGFDRRVAIEETREMAELKGAGALTIENNMADLTIVFADVDVATAHLFGKGLDADYTFLTESRHSGYYIKLHHQSGGLVFDYSDIGMEVILPESYSGNLTVKSASGDVDLAAHSFGSVEIDASTGHVRLGDLTVEKMRLIVPGGLNCGDISGAAEIRIQGSGGKITMGSLVADRVFIDSKSGAVSIGGVDNGAITVRSDGGRIVMAGLKGSDVTTTSASADISLSYLDFANQLMATSTSGDIKVSLPGAAAFSLSARGGGGVQSDFALNVTEAAEKNRLEGAVGGEGGGQVRLASESGKIRLLVLTAAEE